MNRRQHQRGGMYSDFLLNWMKIMNSNELQDTLAASNASKHSNKKKKVERLV